MKNVIVIGLLLTTLATAGVWSTTPEKVNIKDDVIVKEGPRTVVVEFEKDDGNTKVSISPPEGSKVDDKGHDSTIKGKISDTVENVKEKLEEENINGHRETPRELVCDALGKCKHKIASAIGKTKEMVSEKGHEAADKAYEMEEEAKGAAGEAFGKVKDTVMKKTHEASDKVKDAASEVSHKGKATVEEKVHGIKEGVKEKAKKVKSGAEEPVDTTKTLIGEAERNASKKIEPTKRKASEKVKEAEEKIEQVSQKGKKDLKNIFQRGRKVVNDVFGFVFSPQSMVSGVGILQLLGLATAYGMSIWVTFISSYILSRILPRQQFASVQSKIYPVYFRAMACSVGIVLLGHLLSQRKKLSSGAAEFIQGFNLLGSLLMLLFDLRYLEPRATKVIFERMKLEKEEGIGVESSTAEPSRVVDSITEPTGLSSATTTTVPSSTHQENPEDAAAKSEIVRLSEKLKKLNSYSSFLNILTLMALTWQLVHLGQRLHTVC